MLEWFNYPCASAQLKLAAKDTKSTAPLLGGQLNGGESCIVLKSGPIHVSCLQYANFVLQMRNTVKKAMDGCVRNFPMVPEVHQNNHSYLHELSGPTIDPLHKNLA